MRIILAITVALATCTTAVAGDIALFVDLQTDYRPGTDFIAVSAELTDERNPPRTRKTSMPAFTTDAYGDEVRVASFSDLDEGEYKLVLRLLRPDRSVAAEQALGFRLRRNFGVAFVISTAKADLTVSLVGDADHNGAISYGDTVRHNVKLRQAMRAPPSPMTYADSFSDGGVLCTGTVRASSGGAITKGNKGNDRTVEVRFSSVGDAEATVTYDSIVAPRPRWQGTLAFTADREARRHVTDDPGTPARSDATVREAKLTPVPACRDDTIAHDAQAAERIVGTGHRKPQGLPPSAPDLQAPPDPNLCVRSVQSRQIPWGRSGSTKWPKSKLIELCTGAEDSNQPGVCFQTTMNAGLTWTVEDALALCAGTRDARAQTECYKRRKGTGASHQQAIILCTKR